MFRSTFLRSLVLPLTTIATAVAAGGGADKATAPSAFHALVDAQVMRNIDREPELRRLPKRHFPPSRRRCVRPSPSSR